MQDPIAMSDINIFLFIVYIFLQYLSFTAVDESGYQLREIEHNPVPERNRMNFFDST